MSPQEREQPRDRPEPDGPAAGQLKNVETIPPPERDLALALRQAGYGTRKIATRLGRNRKTVRRILERSFPLPEEEPPHSLTAAARVTVLLGEVDGGSLDGFADLDTRPADEAAEQSGTDRHEEESGAGKEE